jgi:Mg2+ and Co2+ transporter CorA
MKSLTKLTRLIFWLLVMVASLYGFTSTFQPMDGNQHLYWRILFCVSSIVAFFEITSSIPE